MTTLFRIFAHNGQITGLVFGNEHPSAHGVEVHSGQAEDLKAELAALAPSGVGSPWPPVGTKPAELPKPRAKKPEAKE
ncbi:hypothetical protein [Achromobacter sp. DH1f]|uniref:hypothetical protein n=1 Tax=Achromobacter sp. DH1f TaxID=1397275 RepID=UPI00046AAA5F|nr:hypothetical protein [Achromobacter sp. DH1f]